MKADIGNLQAGASLLNLSLNSGALWNAHNGRQKEDLASRSRGALGAVSNLC